MVGSGEKVIDDRSADFFAAVESKFPKLLAVEMEGAGATAAIQEAKDEGRPVGFLMIRGISDMPPGRKTRTEKPPGGMTKSAPAVSDRDQWKSYAANAAASFAVYFIAQAWPLPPVGEAEPGQARLSARRVVAVIVAAVVIASAAALFSRRPRRATEMRSLRVVRKTERDAATVYAEPARASTAKGELLAGSCVPAGRTQAGPGGQGHLVVWVDIQTWEGRVHVAGWVLASSLVAVPMQVGDGGEPTPASP